MSPMSRGFHVARNVLSADDTAALREALLETIDRVAYALRTPYATSRPEASLEERLEQVARTDAAYATVLHHAVMADTQHDPRVKALALHPRLGGAVQDAVAPLVPTGHVIRARVVIPAFQEQRTHWHQDVVRPSDDGKSCGSVRVACWIPLSDAEEDTGALEVMPGTWEAPLPHEAGADGRFTIAEADLPDAPRLVVPARRGDVVLLDRFVPHRALPVRHGRARWAVVMWVKAAAAQSVAC
jgi:ectoine hydroxylase-related dioxygenase (phytanoyl-CoA dioxygenase family)